jgi:hypothetical protein
MLRRARSVFEMGRLSKLGKPGILPLNCFKSEKFLEFSKSCKTLRGLEGALLPEWD